MRLGTACMLVAALAAPMALGGEGKIKVLVVTGGHGFNRDAFFAMFKDNPEIEWTEGKQGKTSTAYDREDLLDFDVVFCYDMVQGITDVQKKAFLSLFEKGIGLVVNHHALASYQAWPEFEKAVGGKFLLRPEKQGDKTIPKSGTGGGKLTIHVEAKNHPIAQGLSDYELHDEYYNRCRVSPDVTLVLTTDCPGNNREICWCREHGKSRVVYLMSGHDNKVYSDANHRKVIANAIRWAARR